MVYLHITYNSTGRARLLPNEIPLAININVFELVSNYKIGALKLFSTNAFNFLVKNNNE